MLGLAIPISRFLKYNCCTMLGSYVISLDCLEAIMTLCLISKQLISFCLVQVSKLSDGRRIFHTCGSSMRTCICLTNFKFILLLLFTFSIVICYIMGCPLLFLLFSCCSLELTCPTSVLSASIFSRKNSKSCKVAFRFPGSLSTSSMTSLYDFCVHLTSFFLFDMMSGYLSVFIPSCVNVKINPAVSSFGKILESVYIIRNHRRVRGFQKCLCMIMGVWPMMTYACKVFYKVK